MSADWTFPPVPPELKALAPFFQRAQELKVKDAAMAYWCTYYAAKQGISSKLQSKEARPFLYQVMTVLEEMKASLGNNDAVEDDDAGAAYIENFALRVFTMADNEDRHGEAQRSTAKKFLAAANFFELLHIFDKPVDADIEEKIRYSKWKAADIAKAFREGRQPTPGDAHGNAEATTLSPPPPDALSAWSPGTSVAPSPAGHGAEPTLTASPVPGHDVPLPPDPSTPPRGAFAGQLHFEHGGYATPGMWSTMATPGTEDVAEGAGGIGESPSVRAAARRGAGSGEGDDAWSTVGNQAMSRQGSWTVVDGPPPPPQDEGLGLQAGGTPVKKVHFSPSVVGGLSSTASSVAGTSPPGSPERFAPTLPTVQEGSDASPPHEDPALPRSGSSTEGSPPVVHKVPSPTAPLSPNGLVPGSVLPPPPQHVGASPQFPSAPPQLPSAPPQLPSAPPQLPTAPQFPAPPPQFPTAPPQAPGGPPTSPHGGLPPPPSAPHRPHPHPHDHRAPGRPAPPPPPPPRRSPSPPPELTSTQITRVQKHCKFAISALDYEDVHTARRELRAALEMLGG